MQKLPGLLFFGPPCIVALSCLTASDDCWTRHLQCRREDTRWTSGRCWRPAVHSWRPFHIGRNTKSHSDMESNYRASPSTASLVFVLSADVVAASRYHVYSPVTVSQSSRHFPRTVNWKMVRFHCLKLNRCRAQTRFKRWRC